MLPIVAKMAEKAVQIQVIKHMESNQMFNHNHHSYRANLCTTTAILQLADTIWEGADSNLINATMAIDKSAAFDCINFDIFKEKLKIYKFSNQTVKWMDSYLKFRSQYTTIGGKDSTIFPVICGVL